MIYRKLKDYIHKEGNTISVIFGDLMSTNCEFRYKNYQTNEWQTYIPSGTYCGEYDFLLDLYVRGIMPRYKIVKDKIIPYLLITLGRDKEYL